ncbi:MAG: hemagglutinin protein [Bacteroidetes bacterium]|nr:MAG: hemagglutinin protein [Bacteroidota bacterium]
MAEPVFTQSGSSPLYLLTYGPTTVSTAAFYTTSVVTSPLSLSNSWTTAGVYLFLGEALLDVDAFVSELQAYLSQSPNSSIRFLWIVNPNTRASAWVNYSLQVQSGNTYSVSLFNFGSYTLSIGGGCAVSLQNQGDNYSFSIQQPSGQSLFYFQAQGGQYNYPLQGNSVTLSFVPGFEGAWQFQLPLGGSGNASFDSLDIGLRYYIDQKDFPGYLQSLRYPVFMNPSAGFLLNGNLDPVNPLVASRTFFSFPPSGSFPLLNSYFRTNLGQAVTLTPEAGTGFVFALLSTAPAPSPADGYTLVPQGNFTIGLPAGTPAGPSAAPVSRLMLGSSGVEYAGLLIAAGNLVNFVPGQPAYAPAFQYASETIEPAKVSVTDTALTNAATTSWLFVNAPSGSNVNYYAQPEDAVLYEVTNSGQLADYLGYMETLAGVFVSDSGLTRAAGSGSVIAYPAVPYAGIVADDVTDYNLLELQVISPARRLQIKQLMQQQAVTKTGDAFGVTPQGLKVGLDVTKTYWKSLTMAHSGAGSAAGQAEQLLQLTNITGDFKAALQSNQLFMVAANKDIFLSCASTNFQLTRLSMTEIETAGVPSTVLCTVRSNPSMEGKWYADKDSFDTDLLAKIGQTDFDSYKDIFHRYASQATLAIGEEEFYELSSADVTALNSCGSGWTIPASVISLLGPVTNVKYATRDAYTAAVSAAVGTANWTSYGYVLLEYGRVVTGGWDFNISPYTWDWSDTHPTLFVMKYSGKSLFDLASDTSTWAWQEVAKPNDVTKTISSTQSTLLGILNDAIAAAESGVHDFDNFVAIVTDPNWNGILVLNSYMALDTLPQELQGLAAGIDAANFYGHHLGINITPVHTVSGALSLRDTALFGLVYYNDPVDQYNEGEPYAFKVLSLNVLFKNSVITDFFSQVELMMNKVFGETCMMVDTIHGNNLVLNGSYQKHDGHASYVFVQNQRNVYSVTSAVLNQVEVLQAQFVTVIPPDGLDPGALVQTQFILNGRLRFFAIPYFDCFSFGNTYDTDGAQTFDGYLVYSNLVVHMDFPQETPNESTFTFDASALSFDMSLSVARPESFYSHFPLQLSSLVQQKGTEQPGDLGFMSVVTPLNQGGLHLHWYGFQYALDLGSLGSLAGDAGFSIVLFIGWEPTDDPAKQNIYIGVSLPGSSSGNTKISIEGLLNLVFRKIEITVGEVTPDPAAGVNGGTAYMLKFRGISLSFFGFSFPPGLIDAYIFGNPGSRRSALGWYAAYAKDEKEEKDENKNSSKKLLSSSTPVS